MRGIADSEKLARRKLELVDDEVPSSAFDESDEWD